MLHFKCMPEHCKHDVLLHGRSDTLEQVFIGFHKNLPALEACSLSDLLYLFGHIDKMM